MGAGHGAGETPGSLAAVRSAARSLGLDGECILVSAGPNVVHRCGRVALRAGRDGRAHRRAAVLERLAALGLPVAEVVGEVHEHRGWQVTALAWADHDGHDRRSFQALGEAVGALHRLGAGDVGEVWPPGPCTLGEPWADLDALWDQVRGAKVVDDAALRALAGAVARSGTWRDAWGGEPVVPCHGDVHPGNVRARGGHVVVLDWDACGWGPAVWDHAAIVPWEARWGGAPGSYEAFARGYGADVRDDPWAQRLVTVRLLVATLNLLVSRDPAVVTEGRRRLAHWHQGDAAPVWVVQ